MHIREMVASHPVALRMSRLPSPAWIGVVALAGVSALVGIQALRLRRQRQRLSLSTRSEDCAVSECAADGVPLSSYAG